MALYKTKETALKHLRNGARFQNKSFDSFREDREVALVAMKHDSTFKCIPSAFKNDKDFAEALLCNLKTGGVEYQDMQSIGFDLLNDKKFINLLMGKIPYDLATHLYLASGYDAKNEYSICLKLVEHQAASIMLIPEIFKQDKLIQIAFANQAHQSEFRDGWFKRLIEELGLPDLDSDELVQFIKTRQFNEKLQSLLCTKEETKRTVKI